LTSPAPGGGRAPAVPFLSDLRAAAAEAARSGRNLLVLQEPPWTNGARRLAHVLERDAALAGLLARSFVAVSLDPFRCPEEDARLRLAAAVSGMAAGVPALAVLDPAGRYLVGYAGLAYESEGAGRGPRRYPSLAAVLEASLGRAGEIDVLDGDPGDWIGDGADPAVPDPRLVDPFALLLRLRSGKAEGVRADILRLLEGGVWDHVFGGFHRAARDERLILPHFEKPALHNLAMALLLARLTAEMPGDAALAGALARQRVFLGTMLRDGPSTLAQASNAKRHTWMPQEFFGTVGGDLAFYAGTHFGMTQAKVQHVLYRARPLEASAEACAVDVGRMERLIGESAARLAAFKDATAPAQSVESADAADALSALLMLRLCERSNAPVPVPWPAGEVLGRLLAIPAGDGLLEAGLRLGLAATVGDPLPGPALREAAAGFLGRHVEAGSGNCLTDGGRPSLAVFDGLRLPAIGIAAWALREAGRRLGDEGLERASLRIRERYAPVAGAAPDRCHAHAWLCAGA
jgi:hypothetical protein